MPPIARYSSNTAARRDPREAHTHLLQEAAGVSIYLSLCKHPPEYISAQPAS